MAGRTAARVAVLLLLGGLPGVPADARTPAAAWPAYRERLFAAGLRSGADAEVVAAARRLAAAAEHNEAADYLTTSIIDDRDGDGLAELLDLRLHGVPDVTGTYHYTVTLTCRRGRDGRQLWQRSTADTFPFVYPARVGPAAVRGLLIAEEDLRLSEQVFLTPVDTLNRTVTRSTPAASASHSGGHCTSPLVPFARACWGLWS